MELPQEFQERMKRQLGHVYEDFIASYEKERTYGLRYNPLKVEKNKLKSVLAEKQITLQPVPWAEEGFYYPGDARPGRLALHEAGAYYIQEPSAMAVVELLEPKPGEKILDLCAAPGGKSTQIAGRMAGRGVLVSNEPVPSRAKTLSRNIERMGIANALVLNESPQRLAERFPVFFDRIVADAPCSGEGMFRKEPEACGEWSLQQVEACVQRQRDILSCAVSMLRPGGILVYSTCTFAPQENEENANWLTAQYPDIVPEKSIQIWPHLQRGEGHYAARFCKAGTPSVPVTFSAPSSPVAERPAMEGKKLKGKAHAMGKLDHELALPSKRSKSINVKSPGRLFWEFLYDTLTPELADLCAERISSGQFAVFAQHLYLTPDSAITLSGLKVERAGLQLGCFQKNRFEPSHALAMALHPEQVKRTLELTEPERYLRGETVSCSEQKGWTLVTVQGCSLGWGKAAGGILKNHYPKGLRKNL